MFMHSLYIIENFRQTIILFMYTYNNWRNYLHLYFVLISKMSFYDWYYIILVFFSDAVTHVMIKLSMKQLTFSMFKHIENTSVREKEQVSKKISVFCILRWQLGKYSVSWETAVLHSKSTIKYRGYYSIFVK